MRRVLRFSRDHARRAFRGGFAAFRELAVPAGMSFPEAAAEILAFARTAFPAKTPEELNRAVLHVLYMPDIQVRLARLFRKRDAPSGRWMFVALELGGKGIVRIWFGEHDDLLYVEPILDEKDDTKRFTQALRPAMPAEHFEDAAQAAVDFLIDVFGAGPASRIDIFAPLAPDFDERATVALMERMQRMDEFERGGEKG